MVKKATGRVNIGVIAEFGILGSGLVEKSMDRPKLVTKIWSEIGVHGSFKPENCGKTTNFALK